MTDEQLIQQLRAEAAEFGPAFSHELHRNIMGRIDRTDSEAGKRATPPPTASRSWWRLAAGMSVAAAVGLAVGVMRSARPVGKPVVRPSVAMRIPAAPVISNPVGSLEGPAVRQWAGSQVADVNRDAVGVVAYVQRQLDVLPSPR